MAYRLICEINCTTVAFAGVLMCYPIVFLLLHAMLGKLLFLYESSFMFLSAVGSVDFLQDHVVGWWVYRKTGCTFEDLVANPFTKHGKMTMISMYPSLWAVVYFTCVGWYFEDAQIGTLASATFRLG